MSEPSDLNPETYDALLDLALAEDVGPGDATTNALVSEAGRAAGRFAARESLIVCGLPLAQAVFARLSPDVRFEALLEEGADARPGDALARVEGPARPILTGERLALNFLQRLSGVATLTRRFVEAARGTRARILDTRKTTPGWRALEKYAVRIGGGSNHRMGLYDQMLIKDNHLEFVRQEAGGSRADVIREAVRRARAAAPAGMRIEVEVESEEELAAAAEAGADIVMLDNFSPEQVKAALANLDPRRRPLIEASGGVRLEQAAAYAAAGVDWISAGALTHSARAADIALDFEPSDHRR